MTRTNTTQLIALDRPTRPQAANNLADNLIWVDMLKGVAIVGVFLDNWTYFMQFSPTPAWLFILAEMVSLIVGPFVQVFFLLSGFGLTASYYRQSRIPRYWQKWVRRRLKKVLWPYYLAVIFSFLMGLLGTLLYSAIDLRFSWADLVLHLTFLRNFFPASWIWNQPLWFMPVIIGLYLIFPLLLKLLIDYGPWTLLIVAALITYGSLSLAYFIGPYNGDHQADLFTFWTIQFALGMILAHIWYSNPSKLRYLVGGPTVVMGLGCLFLSLGIRNYFPSGAMFNDLLSSGGIFLILLNAIWVGRTLIPWTETLFVALGSQAYVMYLIHYPIMEFLLGPPLKFPMNPALVLLLGGVYIGLIFIIARFINRALRISSERRQN